MSTSPDVSVIVPARNQARSIGRLLAALEAQTAVPGSFEVIVVDDASTDDTAALVAASPVARVVALDEHGGPYVARNAGIAAARGRLLAFTDADCTPAADWIERGSAALAAGGPDILAGHIEVTLSTTPSLVELLDITHAYDQERYAAEGHVAGGNLWVRREVAEALGRFDGSLLAGADTQFGMAATRAGYKLRYAPDVVVAHPPVRHARQLARRAFRMGFGAANRGNPHAAQRRRRSGAYVDRAAIGRRLQATGNEASSRQVAGIVILKNVLLRAPGLAGNLAGMIMRRAPGVRTDSRRQP